MAQCEIDRERVEVFEQKARSLADYIQTYDSLNEPFALHGSRVFCNRLAKRFSLDPEELWQVALSECDIDWMDYKW